MGNSFMWPIRWNPQGSYSVPAMRLGRGEEGATARRRSGVMVPVETVDWGEEGRESILLEGRSAAAATLAEVMASALKDARVGAELTCRRWVEQKRGLEANGDAPAASSRLPYLHGVTRTRYYSHEGLCWSKRLRKRKLVVKLGAARGKMNTSSGPATLFSYHTPQRVFDDWRV